MKIGFIILAHNQPESIRRLTDFLATGENQIVIHFDAGASADDQQEVRRIAAENPSQIRVISKFRCVWGEWSLVGAVLDALREFLQMQTPPDYIHLMSGADFPLRPVSQLQDFLARHPNLDFIECCDITQKPWVKGGLGRERFRFYYPFNFRYHRKSFDRLVRWHRKLKIRRRMPLGMVPHMGSQWWTLRWTTCSKLLGFIAQHPKVPRFFKSTWIPDESFFQTVIAQIIPNEEIANLQLMFHHLTPSGRPHVFYNDHLPLLKKLPHFFVRKISPSAIDLWQGIHQNQRAKRPIPTCKGISKVRDLVRLAIDRNHEFHHTAPGHIDFWFGPELIAEKRTSICFLITDSSLIPQIESLTRENPRYFWQGRPFLPKRIEMPPDALARMALAPQSCKLRDQFRQQFVHHLVSSTPHHQIPVTVLLMDEDQPDFGALCQLQGMLPVLIIDQPLKLHEISRLNAKLHLASDNLAARSFHLPLSQIPQLFQDLSQ